MVNQGRIRAHGGGQGGGYVALLGKTVSNEGVIAAKLGTVAMASGEKITLNFGGDSLLDVTIDKGTLNALVSNKRAIIANGGQVIMTAKAADQVLSAQVNNTGIIQARTTAALKGRLQRRHGEDRQDQAPGRWRHHQGLRQAGCLRAKRRRRRLHRDERRSCADRGRCGDHHQGRERQ